MFIPAFSGVEGLFVGLLSVNALQPPILQPLPVKAFGDFSQVRSNLQRCYQGAGAHHGSFKNLSRCQLNIFLIGFLIVQQNPVLRQMMILVCGAPGKA